MDKNTGNVRTNDGVNLYYEEAGSGKPIVLIHGGGSSLVWWRRNFTALGERFHVVAVDTRGRGRSDRTDWGHRTARYAKDVHDLIESLGLYDVTLVGWSIGARTCYSYLELFGRHRLRGVVIVDETVHISVHKRPDPGSDPQAEESNEDYYRRMVLGLFGPENAKRITEDEMAWMLEGRDDQPGVQTLGDDYRAQDWRPFCPTIDLPVLVTTGRHSGAYPGCVYAAEHIPGARLVVFESSGHALFYEEADKFNRVVAEFVGGASPLAGMEEPPY